MKQGILILGATSTIAKAMAHELAKKGHPLYLGGREEDELERIASDLQIRYQVNVKAGHFDAVYYEQHPEFLQRVHREIDGIEGVITAFGYLGDHELAEEDFSETFQILDSNFIGATSILNECANYFAKRGSGYIVSFSSVAGDRGRQSNYIYGAAKGALSIFLQGLRNRLYPHGVHVLTVKPGFVDTPLASPETVAKRTLKALDHGRNEVYIPWFWGPITKMIRMIPETFFKRLKL